MLHNPNWDKTVTKAITEPDPFTLESLIAWLEKQPAAKTYCPGNASVCLLGQFASAMGSNNPHSKSFELGDEEPFAKVAFDNDGECTFGAALERARAIAARS